MFIILSVLGLQMIQIGSKPFLCATLRKNIQQEELLYEECVKLRRVNTHVKNYICYSLSALIN